MQRIALSKNQPSQLLALILMSLALWFAPIVLPVEDTGIAQKLIIDMPLNQWIEGISPQVFGWQLLTAVICLIQLLLIFTINNNYMLIPDSNYMPSWIYLFLISMNYANNTLSQELISSSFLILALFLLFSVQQKPIRLSTHFSLGLILSFGGLFDFRLVFFIPVFLMGSMILKNIRWRELAMFILGIACPLVFTWSYFYVFETGKAFFNLYEFEHAVFPHLTEAPGFIVILHDLLLGILALFALFHLFKRINLAKILTRKYMNIILILFFTSTIIYSLLGLDQEFRYYLAVPLSFLLTHYIIHIKSGFLANLFTWGIFLLMLVSNILGFLVEL